MSLSKHIVSEHAITTKINFLSSDFPRSQKPFYYTVHNLPQGIAPQNILRSGHQVKIHDVRGAEGFLSIDVNGFEIVQHTTSVQFESFADESIIRDVYLPECEQLIKVKTGASLVKVFNHLVRRRDIGEKPKSRQPGYGAHVDQSAKGAQTRLLRHLEQYDPEHLPRHYQIINLWRPLKGPIHDSPLAFADFRTVDKDDLVPSDLGYPDPEETFTLRYNPAQEWYYLRDQLPQEVWMFKIFDSEEGKATYAPHSGFLDPNWEWKEPFRQSIEVRALVCYD